MRRFTLKLTPALERMYQEDLTTLIEAIERTYRRAAQTYWLGEMHEAIKDIRPKVDEIIARRRPKTPR